MQHQKVKERPEWTFTFLSTGHAWRETSLLIIHHRILEYYPDLSLRELQEFHEAVDANCSSICTIAKVEIYRRRAQNK